MLRTGLKWPSLNPSFSSILGTIVFRVPYDMIWNEYYLVMTRLGLT
uniref:Uncharacterized protein n=1 Tax=Arundo donax TaxID=35708 RepID=A0A0A9H435_ARUDO